MSSSRCPACRRPVTWGTTRNGRRMPLDQDPRGLWVVIRGQALTADEARLLPAPWCDYADGTRYTPHPARCPRWNPTPRKPRPDRGVIPELACQACGVIGTMVKRVPNVGPRCPECKKAPTGAAPLALGDGPRSMDHEPSPDAVTEP